MALEATLPRGDVNVPGDYFSLAAFEVIMDGRFWVLTEVQIGPLTLPYEVFPFEGSQISVFHLPLQDRPIYLKSDVGKLKQHVDYLRQPQILTFLWSSFWGMCHFVKRFFDEFPIRKINAPAASTSLQQKTSTPLAVMFKRTC